MVIARAGEEIVCPRGTLCGRMVRDVNEQASEDDFILFEDASSCDGRQFVCACCGRIVVVLIEVLRRRPFDRTTELNFQRWGLVALLALAAVISFLDIQRIMTGQFPGVR